MQGQGNDPHGLEVQGLMSRGKRASESGALGFLSSEAGCNNICL